MLMIVIQVELMVYTFRGFAVTATEIPCSGKNQNGLTFLCWLTHVVSETGHQMSVV